MSGETMLPPCETCTAACRRRVKPVPLWRACKRRLIEQWPCSLWDDGAHGVYAGGDNLHMILSNDPAAAGFIADLSEWERSSAEIKPRLKELQQWLLCWYGLRYSLRGLDLNMRNFDPGRRGFWNWRSKDAA